MRKPLVVLAVLCLIPSLGSTVRGESRATGNAGLALRMKFLDQDDWGKLDNQLGLGLLATFGRKSWPVLIAVDYLSAENKETELGPFGILDLDDSTVVAKSKTREFNVGARKIWRSRGFRPYIGGGLAMIKAELLRKGEFVNDRDSALGEWASVGFLVGHHFVLGVDVRLSRAKVHLHGQDVDAGGTHYAVFLGGSW